GFGGDRGDAAEGVTLDVHPRTAAIGGHDPAVRVPADRDQLVPVVVESARHRAVGPERSHGGGAVGPPDPLYGPAGVSFEGGGRSVRIGDRREPPGSVPTERRLRRTCR